MDDDAAARRRRDDRGLVVEPADVAAHRQAGERPVHQRPGIANEYPDPSIAVHELADHVVADETGGTGHEAFAGGVELAVGDHR
jgi:hypothetical protein